MSVKNAILFSLFTMMFYFSFLTFAEAENASPRGGHKKGAAETGYGERRPVNTIEEAENALTEYFAQQDVKIGEISEQILFFEAEIRDKSNNLVDKVIVDKRTGRIRSIY